ncbi:fimbria/pilus outer membrane usher protein [Izhakiella capsodis]|nr:fimbria/pilus outer membrane usher protein [Izhakiella capsodis]
MLNQKKLAFLLFSCPIYASHAATYINTIEPETTQSSNRYLLTLVENGHVFPAPYQATVKNGKIYLPENLLAMLHLPATVKIGRGGFFNPAEIPHLQEKYDADKNELLITIPADWLPDQKVTIPDRWTSAFYNDDVTPGALLNYNIYAEKYAHSAYLSGWLDGIYYNHFGYLDLSGDYTYLRNQGEVFTQAQRLNTTLVINNRRKADKLLLGDITTDNSGGFSGVYMGGIQFRRDFSLRPDIVTYPTLKLSGTAALPSTLDFYVNGSKTDQTKVSPGPYVINNIPFINGDGTMTVVTTDQNGRQVASTIPYNVQQDMLKPGLSDFNMSLGLLRYNYGTPDNEYKNAAASGTWRYGLSDAVTTLSHAEAARRMALLGGGIQYNTGRWGRFDIMASGSEAREAEKGASGYISYTQSFRRASITFSHVQSSNHYLDLSDYDAFYSDPISSDQIFYSQTLPDAVGTLGVGLMHFHSEDGGSDTLANLSYSTVYDRLLTFTLSYSRDFSQTNSNDVMFGITLPFGGKTTVGVQEQTSSGDESSTLLNISHQSGSDLGLDWSANTSLENDYLYPGYTDFSANWKTAHATYSGGAYGYGRSFTPWLGVQGSMVYMDKSLFFSRELGDAFIKVDTDGVGGVPYYYNGTLEGKTSSNGVGFVSDVVPYEKDDVAIDPTHLPANEVATGVKHGFFVPEEAGYEVRFRFNNLSEQQLIRVDAGKSVSLFAGEPIVDSKGRVITHLAYGNMAALSNNAINQRYTLKNNGKTLCSFTLSTKHDTGIEPVLCKN